MQIDKFSIFMAHSYYAIGELLILLYILYNTVSIYAIYASIYIENSMEKWL